MIFYKELNLPHPVNSKQFIEILRLKGPGENITIDTDIEPYLHPDLLKAFESVNVKPRWFASFGLLNTPAGTTSVHTDITFDKEWIGIPLGINWELTPGDTKWSWWDVTGAEVIYPSLDNLESRREHYLLLNGTHYDYRLNADTSKFKLLDSYAVTPNQPVLFRTDIPHQVIYNSTYKQRVCLSLRFSILDIPTWDRALEIFQPFFKE